MAYQQQVFNSIRNQALGGAGGYGGYGGSGAYAGAGASTGTYGGVGTRGDSYGGTYGGRYPNYASSGGYVNSNGHKQQHASIYPANPVSIIHV